MIGKSPRVLLVDDDRAILMSLTRILEHSGMRVSVAENGYKAMEYLTDFNVVYPDIVITDHDMPGMDGYELIRKMKEDDSICRIPIIMLTGKLNIYADAHRIIDAGAEDFISKPPEAKSIIDCINLVLTNNYLFQMLQSVLSFEPETFDHGRRGGMLMLMLGAEMKTPINELTLLRHGFIIHDIGKMVIPIELLQRQGKLDDSDQAKFLFHATHGYEMARKLNMHQIILEIINCHHVAYDGNHGIVDPEIQRFGNDASMYGSMATICDVFDALMSKRRYKDPWSLEKTLKMMHDESGKLFHPEILKVFLEKVVNKYVSKYPYTNPDC